MPQLRQHQAIHGALNQHFGTVDCPVPLMTSRKSRATHSSPLNSASCVGHEACLFASAHALVQLGMCQLCAAQWVPYVAHDQMPQRLSAGAQQTASDGRQLIHSQHNSGGQNFFSAPNVSISSVVVQ